MFKTITGSCNVESMSALIIITLLGTEEIFKLLKSESLIGLHIFPGERILSFSLILKRLREPKLFRNHWVRD